MLTDLPGLLQGALNRHPDQLWTLLEPACYLAVLDRAPFVEEGVRGLPHTRADSVVFGILKEPPDAD